MHHSHESADEIPIADAVGGTWSVEPRTWRVHWSPRARAIHGADPALQPTVWQALEFIDTVDRPVLFSRAMKCAQEGVPFDIEVGLSAPTGPRRVRIVGYPAGAEGNYVLHGTISVVPGTLQPRAGEAVRELMMSIQEWQLIGSAIPHELSGPLANARAFASTLAEREPALSDSARHWISRIIAGCGHMEGVLEGLLQFAPLSTRALRRDPVDLSEIALDCIAVLRDADPQRLVDVQVQPDIKATGDPQLLRLVLANLLGNAWKFTRKVADAVIVFEQPDAHQPIFVVRDNGIGFEMRDAARVFAPFERLHARDQFAGAGIGLAIVRRAIERHGGSVWAHAAPGQGASFQFSI